MKNYIFTFLISILVIFCSCNNKSKTAQTSPPEQEDTITSQHYDSLVTPVYDRYCNTRFNYCINYPSAILIPQGESDNGDGQVFLSADRKNELRVYRDSRVEDIRVLDIEYAYQTDIDNKAERREFDEKTVGSNYYILSGKYPNGKLFYKKTILREYEYITAELTYREDCKEQFQALIEPIFSSLN